jgi:hypothetical protein
MMGLRLGLWRLFRDDLIKFAGPVTAFPQGLKPH